MNSKFVVVAALAAGALAPAGWSQTAAPKATESTLATPKTAPEAVPAKIAFIELTEVAAATNEGQRAISDIQKKYEPTKAKLDQQKAEIDSLTKQLQNAPATMSDEEKSSRAREIDTKQKQLQRDADDAQSSYSSDVQEAIAKIESKLGPVVVKYVQKNGYTMLLDNLGQPQQGGLNLLWGGTDISQAVVDAYNAASGVPAPVPSAPTAQTSHPAARPAAPKR